MLAFLLVHANETVSVDQVVEAVWPEGPPRDTLNALQTQVSRLRHALDRGAPRGGGRLAVPPSGSGYVLSVDPQAEELDADVFESLARRSREAMQAGDHRAAADAAGRALACWRGPVLGDLAGEDFARERAAQLDERRLAVVKVHVDARLALGEHEALVDELQQLVAQHPLREPLWAQLMVALYRSGRQAEALRAYERVRTILDEELGVRPGAELVAVERAVLAHDPDLAWREPSRAPAPGARTGHPVTFLFTDVDRPTALWDRDRDATDQAISAHDAALRDAIEAHHGAVFVRQGDGFGAVFDRATDAVEAALAAQRRLATDGADQTRLRVRMAIHTGEAEARDGGYLGPAVNRTARMRDAGHGGQVLLSAATRELVVDDLPPDAELVDIGSWLFEGSSRPERVHQLAHPDLATGFPPLRSGRLRTGHLPRHSTSFVGRAREVERTMAALGTHQVVTLTGEGGVGKTRLALEVAQRVDFSDYPDGVWFCDMSAIDDVDGVTDHLADHIAGCLGLAVSGGSDVRRALVASLQGARLLLLVDNCERLRGPVADLVGDVMAAGSDATLLVTSRAPLRAQGEHVIQVGPLALSAASAAGRDAAAGADSPGSPAVQLLVDRAAAAGAPVTEGDPALAEIVRRLDGIPLAIELAAPRLASMAAGALAARLDRMFDLLTGPAAGPARQRTLRATIDWSFNLLSDGARTLFGALSVFRGGWTLDTAEVVTEAAGLEPATVAPLMAELVEQSMVRVEIPPSGTARYGMLATMHAYASDHLRRSGGRDAVADRHARHFVELAERAERHRRGPMEPAWVHEIEVELDNIRAAYRWLIESGQAADALRLVAALADELMMHENFEIGRWAQELAGRPEVTDEPLRAVALALAGNTAMVEGRLDDALRLSNEALAVERATGARPFWVARNTLALLAAARHVEGGLHEHLEALTAISRETGDPLPAGVEAFVRVLIAALSGEPERGAGPAEVLLGLGRSHDNPSLLAMGLLSRGRVVAGTEPESASRDYHDALELASAAHNALLVQQSLRAIEELNARSGDRPAALASLRAVVRRFEESGNVSEQMQTIISMLDSLVAMGELVPVATICGALSRTPWRLTAACRFIDSTVASRLPRDEYAAARRAGASMTPTELVAFASSVVQDIDGATHARPPA